MYMGLNRKTIHAAAVIAVIAAAAALAPVSCILLLQPASDKTKTTYIPDAAWSRDISAEGYIDGAPIGGLGAGSVTWRYDGNFYDGRLEIGRNDMDINEGCGFYIFQKPSGGKTSAKRLDAASIGPGQAEYYSLFPKSWVDYYGDDFACKARVTQFSPIIPGDYKLSSYPVGIYLWEVTNPSDKPCEVAIMLTWTNGTGGGAAAPVSDDSGRLHGISIVNSGCEFTIACEKVRGTEISYTSSDDIDKISVDFFEDGFLGSGTVRDKNSRNNFTPDGANQGKTGAICVNMELRPGQALRFPMALAWDMPITKGFKESDWYREYTRYFGRSGANSWIIAQEALKNADKWEASVDGWQKEILDNAQYPDWLKTSLFNELYYYFAGGTVWEAGAASGQPDNPDEDMFGSLECYEFPYYGTSDVRFYGSWALLQLWPEIEKQCVRQFCDSVYTTRSDRPEALGTTAHDFGMFGSAFKRWNGYTYRDSRNWKDLNSKLVLMVYRDWALTGKTDADFLEYCRLPVRKAMEKVRSQDEDGDGLPDSNGIDQTYDNMSLTGDTAYCGGLYLAACEAAAELAGAVGDDGLAEKYNSWLKQGRSSFEEQLWNGSYYNIDTGSGKEAGDSATGGNASGGGAGRIMSDQLCGHWYAVACGLPGIVPDERAVSAFNKIYDFNFKMFDNGTHGIVNVMLPSGEIDTESSQASECWVGTSWGVAAGMIQQGMTEQADEIGRSLYDTIWNTGELWFRTPEAWQAGAAQVRSPYYMRATAVWAVKHAYDISSDAD